MEGKHGNEIEEDAFNSDEEYESEEEDENVGKVIDVAFDARPPGSSDFHGIKRLLQQQDFGTGSDEESDEDEADEDDRDTVFAINTVINMSDHQNMSCIEKINDFLTTKCKEAFKGEPTRLGKLLS